MKLLELFRELSLHPQNATELKGLILQLAVQGKLTAKWREENPDVEPASELLKMVRKEKDVLIKEGLLRKEKIQSSVTDKEKLFIIPTSWIWCRFGEVITLEMGQSPIGSSYNDTGNGVPLINGPVEFGPKPFDETRLLKFTTKPTKLCSKGDLLVCVRGATTGRTNIAGFDACIGRGVAAIKPFFDKQYLNYFMLKSRYELLARGTGTTFPSISRDEILDFVFALPPLEEQHAIVTTVNQLFAEIEQLEQLTKERIRLKHDFATSSLQRLVQADNINGEWTALQEHFTTFFNEKPNVKKLRETILQLAVQGKLTTHWRKENPDTEPATELLKRIAAEKQQLIKAGKIKKENPLPPIKAEEIPFELPEGWVWCRLTDLVDVGTGSTPPKSNPEYYTGGSIPWYTSSATSDEFAKLQDVMITPKAIKETNCKIFPEGSLIIALYGQGKTRGQISELETAGATNQAIAAMVFFETSKPSKKYLKYYFQKIYHEIRLLAEGGAQPNLNVGKIRNTLIPLPPKEEQLAIVTTVNTLMGLCDRLEQEIEQQQKQVEELMRSCVREISGNEVTVDDEGLLMAAEDGVEYGESKDQIKE
jgi:type I restriction enzyme, S subunit